MTRQPGSATGLSTAVRAHTTRWCKPRAAASRTSPRAVWLRVLPKKTELKMVNVARASLEELLLDYQDFLRQRKLPLWAKDHATAQVVRKLAYTENRSYRTYAAYIEEAPPEVAANTLICLINQTNYLLDQQLRQLEQHFLQEGGFTEKLYRVRSQARRKI
jgi:restriction system protein